MFIILLHVLPIPFRYFEIVVENIDKITEVIEVDHHVSSCIIVQEVKINHKTVWNYLRKIVFKNKLDIWALHQLTNKKNIMDWIPICKARRPN